MKQMADAFVENASSDGEDSNSNNQSPEIQFLPMSEGMLRIRSTVAQPQPNRSRRPLPVSTTEWIPSENIAELPVTRAAENFVMAIAISATMAA